MPSRSHGGRLAGSLASVSGVGRFRKVTRHLPPERPDSPRRDLPVELVPPFLFTFPSAFLFSFNAIIVRVLTPLITSHGYFSDYI